jgi:hypothetical protein
MPSSLKSSRREINFALSGIIRRQYIYIYIYIYIYEHSAVCRVIYLTLFSQALLDNDIKCTEISTGMFPSSPFLVTTTHTASLEGHLISWVIRKFDDFLSQCFRL